MNARQVFKKYLFKNRDFIDNDAGDKSDMTLSEQRDMLRRLAGRSDIEVPTGWTPHILYNHLPLADYLARRLP
ncbi:MAG: hypothetical protein ABR497_03890, partial [Kiritimatiellia bacterium]